jgi:hypothetical protein
MCFCLRDKPHIEVLVVKKLTVEKYNEIAQSFIAHCSVPSLYLVATLMAQSQPAYRRSVLSASENSARKVGWEQANFVDLVLSDFYLVLSGNRDPLRQHQSALGGAGGEAHARLRSKTT